MLIPRYWSRSEADVQAPSGKRIHLRIWRGSRDDPAEAQTLAAEALERVAARVRAGDPFPERYAYGDRPLREEIVRELDGAAPDGGPGVALTRNSYGAVVLNAAQVFFIDVDVPPAAPPQAPSPVWKLAEGLLGRSGVESLPPAVRSILEGVLGPAAPAAPADAAAPAQERLRRWMGAHPDWRVRVYRTHSGLRYAVTHRLFQPAEREVQEAMSALGADPQYVRLCSAQKSFRARLTPKPWRVGVENPPVSFPYEGPAEEREMRAWEATYDRASQGYASARLLEELGGGADHPEAAAVLAVHDEHTRAGSGLPLA